MLIASILSRALCTNVCRARRHDESSVDSAACGAAVHASLPVSRCQTADGKKPPCG